MSNPVPSSLALTTIAGNVSASPLNSDYGAIQTAVNALITATGGGAVGQVLQAVDSSHVQWAYPPGYELGVTTWTGTTSITGTSSGSPTTVVTAPAITFDGAAVIVEFQAAWYKIGSTNINVGLYLDGSLLARLGFSQGGTYAPAGVSAARVTPAAGSHTYSVRAYVDAGTGEVGADAGLPGFIRVTKV